MSIANKLYDRSHGFVGDVNATNPADVPTLYVDGMLPGYYPSAAYEGRLQIHNNIGACTVELVSGDLPPGYSLSVDSAAEEVVIRWPAYKTDTVDIPNSGFSAGDDGSWEMGEGFTIMQGVTAPDPNDPSNNWQAQFADIGGESQIMSSTFFPVKTGVITASVDVQQGASSANKAGGAVRVLFFDGVGFPVGGMDGNVIKSGSDSNWQTSTVKVSVPPSAAYAKVGASAYRSKQNKALWIDNIKWDLSQPSQGVSTNNSIPLSIKVKDTTGRIALWSGIIYSLTPVMLLTGDSGTSALIKGGSVVWSQPSTYVFGVYAGDRFIVVGINGSIYESMDGTVFTPLGLPAVGITGCDGFCWTGKSLIAIFIGGSNPGTYKSKDKGKSWQKVVAGWWGNTFNPYSARTRSVGLMCTSVGPGGQIFSVDDGDTWQAMPMRFGTGITLCQGKYYWLGTDGTVVLYVYDPEVSHWAEVVNPSWPYAPRSIMYSDAGGVWGQGTALGLWYSTDMINFSIVGSLPGSITDIAMGKDGIRYIYTSTSFSQPNIFVLTENSISPYLTLRINNYTVLASGAIRNIT